MKTELGLVIPSPVPAASPEKVARLIGELRSAKKRLSAAELAVLIFGKNSESAKRRVRSIARAARPRVVSFPGSDGYDLWKRCKVDDIWHAIYAMEAQGKDLISEARSWRVALHSGYRGEPGDDGQAEMSFSP